MNTFRFSIYVKGDRGIQTLMGLKGRNLQPAVCFSEKDDPIISNLCSENNIPYFVESRPKKNEHVLFHDSFRVELLVCAGYSKILPAVLFESLKFGAINCHGGRLPNYRGASPIPWQIINDEPSGTAYVLRMTGGVDDGPILAQEDYEIRETDTARSITDKVSKIFEKIIPDVIESIARGNVPQGIIQDETNACHWTRRYPEDGLIAWDKLTTRQAVNLIRALDDPYPGAFVLYKGEKLVVRRAREYPKKMMGVAGRCVGKTDQGTLVLARDGAVEILEFIQNGEISKGDQFPAVYGDTF